MVKRPKKIGIWISIGKQPPTGLIPYSLYSFITSEFIRVGSSLYFSRSSWILGESADMRRIEAVALLCRGQSDSFTIVVSARMAAA